jgi:hypothetical protein
MSTTSRLSEPTEAPGWRPTMAVVPMESECPFCGEPCGHWAAAEAERDRLRAVADAARAINAMFQADAESRRTGLPVLIDRMTLLELSVVLEALDRSDVTGSES